MNVNKPNIFIILLCCFFILLTIFNINPIKNKIANLLDVDYKITEVSPSKYALETKFEYVQHTDEFTPYSKQDIMNVIYTTIDNGWNNFNFYCPKEYTKCIDDITEITDDQEILTHINNFVHPYNSFSNLKTKIKDNGEITLNIDYLYTFDEVKTLEDKVSSLIKELITEDMDDYEKIKTVHDYIINNSKYDISRNNDKASSYNSYTAFGPLIEGYATCNGYTDAMAIFLNELGYKNYKIATTPENRNLTGHIWNAVYVNDKWLHLDVTWDDPVSDDGKDYLLHKYFLVTNEELIVADQGDVVVTEHNFLKRIYSEFK